ncbi:phosphoenolpyruvate hydrolase family protein [Bradyrhizobium arachidis]|uniref:phosphoenolpyruvate hydrolase family protein n=1 Tax=Bradyrhizobium arachidis TaxID=858423 RepID=UPI002163C63C|nr:phosphoenolpyruvate hydrolase family protein [Bradyrhizobium arachidis]
MFKGTEILSQLAGQVAKRKAILAAASSCGLVAKCAALGRADMLVVYSIQLSRLPTSRLGDSNARTLEVAAEIRNVVFSVPVIGGVEAWAPLRLDLEGFSIGSQPPAPA